MFPLISVILTSVSFTNPLMAIVPVKSGLTGLGYTKTLLKSVKNLNTDL